MPIEAANPDATEAALIRAIQAGDAAAFEPLVDTHLDSLRAFIALKLPVAHLVDELAHETFVFAFRNLAGFTAGTSFRAWLRAISANLIRAELQRYAREQQNQFNYARARELERSLMTGPGAGESAEVEHLRDCVAGLPPHLKELVDLKYAQDESIETIATKLARTENAVWQALFRLRTQLKQCVEGKLGRTT
jgi:RNA polymerase sigma-70 factor (ECF subfamily)